MKILMKGVLILWLISASALDSPTWTPFIINAVCTAILGLYAWANDWFYEYDYKED